MIVHRAGMRSEAEGCVIAGQLELFCGQAIDKMVGRRTEVLGGQRSRQAGTKKSAKRFENKGVFRGHKMMKCPVVKKMELAAREMVRSEGVTDGVTRFDAAHREKTAQLERNRTNSGRHQPF